MKKINFLIAIFLIFLLVLPVSCSKTDKNNDNFSVTATFYPLYVMLLNITQGTDVSVSLLAPPETGCLHDYQLTTNDMKILDKTDVIVINGCGMEDFLDKVISNSNKKVIDSSAGFSFIDKNPHIWVSPTGAIHQVNKIATELSSADPKNAELYLANAKEYTRKLEELLVFMHQELDSFANSNVITFHEAFPYFAKEFNLNIAGVIQQEHGDEPTAKELLELIELIKSVQNKTGKNISLFAENQYASSAAEIIAKETGLTVYELNTAVTGLMPKTTEQMQTVKDSYILTMKENTQVLKKAL